MPEWLAYEVHYQSDQLEVLILPKFNALMLNHLGEASEEEYKSAVLSLLTLQRDYPWKISISNELHLRQVPFGVKVWMGTRFLFMPSTKELFRRNEEFIILSANSKSGNLVSKAVHTLISQFSGKQLTEIYSMDELLTYLDGRLSDSKEQVDTPRENLK